MGDNLIGGLRTSSQLVVRCCVMQFIMILILFHPLVGCFTHKIFIARVFQRPLLPMSLSVLANARWMPYLSRGHLEHHLLTFLGNYRNVFVWCNTKVSSGGAMVPYDVMFAPERDKHALQFHNEEGFF